MAALETKNVGNMAMNVALDLGESEIVVDDDTQRVEPVTEEELVMRREHSSTVFQDKGANYVKVNPVTGQIRIDFDNEERQTLPSTPSGLDEFEFVEENAEEESEISVRVPGYEIFDDPSEEHQFCRYKLLIEANHLGAERRLLFVRYSEFRKFQVDLKNAYPEHCRSLPSFPSRTIKRSFSVDHLEMRKEALDKWLHAVAKHEYLSKVDETREFLKLPYHEGDFPVPALRVVIMIVGSRGDVQPFVALGKALKAYGHRVRLATHERFREFVTGSGLSFFPIAGDPEELMEFMVKNPGIVPKDPLHEVPKKRKSLIEIMESCWPACTAPDEDGLPFVAEAIIANPPSFAHIHIAEKLHIPCHIFFTMPWTPTRAFPHPLAAFGTKTSPNSRQNELSYEIVGRLHWQGLIDLVNRFRVHTLGIPEIHFGSGGYRYLIDSKVPHTYCWSPSLIPKPKDWGTHIDVCGFFFLDLKSNYTPPDPLVKFLEAGSPPVYIGFGSIVVEDPDGLTQTIFEAVKKAGVRAIISKGWGGIGGSDVPDDVFLIGNCPHDWLFQNCSAVCHHGGAGTTAAGLKAGLPSIVVPFFGDQPFWGSMISRRGVGPAPIPIGELTVEKLTSALEYTRNPDVVRRAKLLGEEMNKEDGVAVGVRSFHRHLPVLTMVCDIDPSQTASVWCRDCDLKLSFSNDKIIHSEKMGEDMTKHTRLPYRYIDWSPKPPSNALEGLAKGAIGGGTALGSGLAGIIAEPFMGARKHGAKGAVYGVGKGIAGAVLAPAKGGVIFFKKAADGLRNTPNLLGGGQTVSSPTATPENVGQGLVQGTKSAGKGIYDGFKGLVVDPYKGAKDGGFVGGAVGMGRGLVGLVCKPLAGTIDFFTITAEGVKNSVGQSSRKEKDKRLREDMEASNPIDESNLDETEKEVIRLYRSRIATITSRKTVVAGDGHQPPFDVTFEELEPPDVEQASGGGGSGEGGTPTKEEKVVMGE